MLIADTVATWLRLGEDRPTLCFAVDRAHARKLADQFDVAGVPAAYVDMDNVNRTGERIYHTPWSPWYDRTQIDETAGERWFCDEAEAIAAGWRAPCWR